MKFQRQSLWVVLLLIPLLWWAWPSGKKSAPGGDASPAQSQKSPAAGGSGPASDGGGPARTRAARRQQQPAVPLKPAESPEVDRILINESITNEQAAAQLHVLAMDRTRSTAHRLEALQHGLNLGIGTFADFAEQPDLPPELASHFLNEIINYNDSPATQIRAYMALMDHPDQEVSALAKEMLAFQVEDDLQEASREQLIQHARQKLADLAKEPAE
jgi:hypothetical protein